MAAVPPLPPSTPVFCRQFFFIASLAKLGNLESFKTMLFFFSFFPLIIFFKFSFIQIYLNFSASPVLLKILKQNLLSKGQ